MGALSWAAGGEDVRESLALSSPAVPFIPRWYFIVEELSAWMALREARCFLVGDERQPLADCLVAVSSCFESECFNWC